MDDSILSPEERKMVDDFAKQIDIRNSAGILQYGAGTQKWLTFPKKLWKRSGPKIWAR